MITLRFDMRIRDGGAPTADLCAAAIEMCAWAEARGTAVERASCPPLSEE
ncbi:MAG: hypothetical protein ACM4D3_24520 [Candidatus Sericytochromatia bacterium]